MCSNLGITKSQYYAWRQRERAPVNRRLRVLIRSLHRHRGQILGYWRIRTCLAIECGERIGEDRVRRLMKQEDLSRRQRQRKRSCRSGPTVPNIPDLLERDFSAAQPNAVWGTDITEFKTGEGKLSLCVIKDVYKGTLVSWKTGARATAAFVVATVEWAVAKVKLAVDSQPIIHSEHGCQYTSKAYRECLPQHGLRISMGRIRTCADNASTENVSGILTRELSRHCQFRTRREATKQINQYFLTVYNSWRRVKKPQHQSILSDELKTETNGES